MVGSGGVVRGGRGGRRSVLVGVGGVEVQVVQLRRCLGSHPSSLVPWPPSSPPCRRARPRQSLGRRSGRTTAPGSSHGRPLQDGDVTVTKMPFRGTSAFMEEDQEEQEARAERVQNRTEGRRKVLLAFGGGVSERVLIDSLERENEVT